MGSKDKYELIREGNAAFNDGDMRLARECFFAANYKDGLIRMGDYYMYDRKLPMLAFSYYKKAGHEQKIQEIYARMVMALGAWIGHDKIKMPESTLPDPEEFRVHPILRAKALEILEKNNIPIP